MTRMCILLLLLLALGGLCPGLAGAQLKVTYGSEDCRMRNEDLRPLMQPYNPFVSAYKWQPNAKIETVQLGPDRLLTISQEACLRHHIRLELVVTKDAAQPYDANFYPREVIMLMNRVFYHDADYYSWKLAFEEELLKAYARAGINQDFSFNVHNLNFQGKFNGGSWGATLDLELIRYLLAEKVRLPGIEAYKDDGLK
ncbi:MAG: hypothetical protein LW884_02135 [Bacteroidetes bacterium]|jgi:hypothetical protein|nr:hypothetical protein [Bacteroidota bacterium]